MHVIAQVRGRLVTVAALVLVLAAVSLAGCSTDAADDGSAGPSGRTSVAVRMLVEQVPGEVSAGFEEGDAVRVKNSGAVVGEIIGVEVRPATEAVPTSEGELEAAENPVLDDVYLDITGEADVRDDGYVFDGTYVYVNEEVVYLTPTIAFTGLVTSIGPAE